MHPKPLVGLHCSAHVDQLRRGCGRPLAWSCQAVPGRTCGPGLLPAAEAGRTGDTMAARVKAITASAMLCPASSKPFGSVHAAAPRRPHRRGSGRDPRRLRQARHPDAPDAAGGGRGGVRPHHCGRQRQDLPLDSVVRCRREPSRPTHEDRGCDRLHAPPGPTRHHHGQATRRYVVHPVLTQVYTKNAIYWRSLGLEKVAKKHWLKLDLTTLPEDRRPSVEAMVGLGQAGVNPARSLQQLRTVVNVAEVGREQLRGVDTRHLKGSVKGPFGIQVVEVWLDSEDVRAASEPPRPHPCRPCRARPRLGCPRLPRRSSRPPTTTTSAPRSTCRCRRTATPLTSRTSVRSRHSPHPLGEGHTSASGPLIHTSKPTSTQLPHRESRLASMPVS